MPSFISYDAGSLDAAMGHDRQVAIPTKYVVVLKVRERPAVWLWNAQSQRILCCMRLYSLP